jgi:hypothetical protein
MSGVPRKLTTRRASESSGTSMPRCARR